MSFESRLASGPEKICDLFAEFIQRTYVDDVWVPSDPIPEHVPDDPPFGALQFTSYVDGSVLQGLDVNKDLYVTPIFKKGRHNNVEDYRGVVILSAIPKRFELLVYREMYNDLKNLMSINQHGFMKTDRR
jgi:hypothetical protein